MEPIGPPASQGVSDEVSLLAENTPATPKLPFDPPCRRSSLGFSKITPSPVHQDSTNALYPREQYHTSQQPGSNMLDHCPAESTAASELCSDLDSEHATQVQRILESAKANLHMDMSYAASPAGSIGSRLPSEPSPRWHAQVVVQQEQDQNEHYPKSWRYSTVPSVLAASSMDVREPIPNGSPALPVNTLNSSTPSPAMVELPSSGHALLIESDSMSPKPDSYPLPSSSPPTVGVGGAFPYNLEQQMTSLLVESDSGSAASTSEDYPLIDSISNDCTQMERNHLFLSRSAKAAADSAKEKRTLLRHFQDSRSAGPDAARNSGCPNPRMHQLHGANYLRSQTYQPDIWICPNPDIHARSNTPAATIEQEVSPCTPQDSSRLYTNNQLFKAPLQRIAANGSPMPFARPQSRPRPMNRRDRSHTTSDQSPSSIYQPRFVQEHLSGPSTPTPTPTSEHFQPGWYYIREESKLQQQAAPWPYSFSTAAASAIGESAAPDSRIRDSYRTDTLTTLAKPPSRFRKNGIGAELRAQDKHKRLEQISGDVYLAQRSRISHEKPAIRAHGAFETQSSPLRPLATDRNHKGRKRSRSKGIYSPEPGLVEDHMGTPHFETFKDTVHDTDSTNIMEDVQLTEAHSRQQATAARNGVQELSPNVRIWRKGSHNAMYSRKKRRPSYWDNDLEEIRKSPAGRGGIESSPTMSKRSMFAEIENIERPSSDSVSTNSNSFRTVDTDKGNVNEDERDELYHTNFGNNFGGEPSEAD